MALLNLVAYTGDSTHLTSQEVANVTNQLEGLAAYAVDDVKVCILNRKKLSAIKRTPSTTNCYPFKTDFYHQLLQDFLFKYKSHRQNYEIMLYIL